MNDQVVIYLDFKLDLNVMKVCFSQNKRFRILKVVNDLQKIHTMIYISLEEILNFLSYNYVKLIYDNSVMIDAICKCFIKDNVIYLFQVILLIIIIFDIEFTIF